MIWIVAHCVYFTLVRALRIELKLTEYTTGTYGGTSLFRGLCALPWILPLPGKGVQKMQPIYLKDVAISVLSLLSKPNNTTEIIHLVGPEKLSLRSVLENIRNWFW